MTTRTTKTTATAIAIALSLALAAPGAQALFGNSDDSAKAGVQLPDFTRLVEKYGKAVVNISMVKKAHTEIVDGLFGNIPQEQAEIFKRFGFPFFGGGERVVPEQKGTGSGFIIAPNGLILTNAHVVNEADEITVRLTDERKFKGKVLGLDTQTDIAVVKIEADNLPCVNLGNSDEVKVGEWVAAIGSPFGLTNSVTAGIVSAKSRNLPDENLVPFIQTDVAINPGNSGGPLFNMQGEVIGINSQIFSTSGGSMGLSFAIPINLASQVKDQILESGGVTRGRIGVMIQALTPELAKGFGIPEDTKGALVAEIENGGPASKSSLKTGDIITGINGEPVKNYSEVMRRISFTAPGTRIELDVLRNKKAIKVSVTVGAANKDGTTANRKEATKADPQKQKRLGISVRELTKEEAEKMGVEGLLIGEVSGAAAKAGIKRGDVILAVNGTPVDTVSGLSKAIEGETSVAVLVQRGKNRIYVPVKMDAAE